MNLHPATIAAFQILDQTPMAIAGAVLETPRGITSHQGRHDSTRFTRAFLHDAIDWHVRWTAFDGAPGILVTATAMLGDVTRAALLSYADRSMVLYLPTGVWAVSESRPTASQVVPLPIRLLPGSRAQFEFALVPESFKNHPGILAGLRYRPWAKRERNWIDGLPRATPPVGFDHTKADDEGPITTIDQGGATSGNLVRMDYGAEFAALPAYLAWDEADHWRRVVMSRPQRGFFYGENGEPLRHADTPPKFDMSIGPTEVCFTKAGNVYGFDETWIAANAGQFLGSIDLAHFIRAFQWDAYLAQEFGDPVAIENLRWWAAAARLDTPTLRVLSIGGLARQHAWNLVVQHLDWHYHQTEDAGAWCVEALHEIRRHQRANGGLCAWTTNKEATAYALDYLESIGKPRVVRPVTRPEQEILLAYAWHTTGPMFDREERRAHLRFIFGTCRQPGRRGPWERCGIDGERLSTGDTTFYAGTGLAIALSLDMPEAAEWIRDYCAGADTPAKQVAWLRARKPSDWRNNFHLIGALEMRL